jgi:hypothetical protein
LYLACFFNYRCDIAKAFRWTIDEITWQIHPDGSSYEGSTQYHIFVSELIACAHMILSCHDAAHWSEICTLLSDVLEKMVLFTASCTPHRGQRIIIGDDDGALLLPGKWALAYRARNSQHVSCEKRTRTYHYPQFGISVIKGSDIHCTLRHHAYVHRQPTAHFHSDIMSISLSWKQISFFVDPGTYVYSASGYWRNYFRSHENHTSFWMTGVDPIVLSRDIFFLDVPVAQHHDVGDNDACRLMSFHDLYQHYGLRACRSIEFLSESNRVVMSDWWEPLVCNKHHDPIPTSWAFVLSPELMATKTGDRITVYEKKGKRRIAFITSSLTCTLTDGYVSPTYGIKKRTVVLRAQEYVPCDTRITTIVDFMI